MPPNRKLPQDPTNSSYFSRPKQYLCFNVQLKTGHNLIDLNPLGPYPTLNEDLQNFLSDIYYIYQLG